MAVAFDAVGPDANGSDVNGAATLSWNHTCSGSNRLLVVSVAVGVVSPDTGVSISSVTYNGVSMTAVTTPVHSSGQDAGFVQMFYLVAPATGTNTVAVTVSTTVDAITAGSVSFTGVDQSTPLTNTATNIGPGGAGSTTASVSVTTQTGDMVIDGMCCGGGFGTGSTQTNRWLRFNNTTTGAGCAASSTATGSGSVTMSYNISQDWWGIIGTNVSAAAAPPPPSSIVPPTFVAASNSTYGTASATKSVSVTTQTGDLLIVYGGADTGATSNPGVLTTPVGNNIAFTLLQSYTTASNTSAFIWWGTESSGGTWTLSCGIDDSTAIWGFTCVVFRGSAGVGASNKAQAIGAPTLGLTTVQANSAIVVFNDDWAGRDGTSRTWSTVNGITPTNGNGLELTYNLSAGVMGSYGAYYNTAGPAGAKTVGLTVPNNQQYTIVAAEVLGVTPGTLATVAWFHI